MEPSDHLKSFSAAYAKAIVQFLRSQTPQAVYFDRARGNFYSYDLAAGTSPTDVDCYVGSDWDGFVGDLSVPANPADRLFSEAVLAQAVMERLCSSRDADAYATRLATGTMGF